MSTPATLAAEDLCQAALRYGRATAQRIGSGKAAWRQALTDQAPSVRLLISACGMLDRHWSSHESKAHRQARRGLAVALRHRTSPADLARRVVRRQLHHKELPTALWAVIPRGAGGLVEHFDRQLLRVIAHLHQKGEPQAADALIRRVSQTGLLSIIRQELSDRLTGNSGSYLHLPALLRRYTLQPDLALWTQVARYGDPHALRAMIQAKNPLGYPSSPKLETALKLTQEARNPAASAVLWPHLVKKLAQELTDENVDYWESARRAQFWDTLLVEQAGAIAKDPALSSYRDWLVAHIELSRLPQETARRLAEARSAHLAQRPAIVHPRSRRRV